MGDNITLHELLTLFRHYNAHCIKERYTEESLRSIVHTEMKRFLFNHVERLYESFLQQDPGRSGNVSRDMAYAICRGAKLPVNKDLLNAVLDKICKNEAGEINYRDLLEFLDLKKITATPSEPIDIQYNFTFLGNEEDGRIGPIDCRTLLKDLDLERQVIEESG
jgi:Ca2+-binding EF-hand superfamily protein